jgi:endonuclease YncB( thermonuclease family)
MQSSRPAFYACMAVGKIKKREAPMRAILLFIAAAALAPVSALADFTGRVVKVIDGDTLTALVNKKQIRVRLDAIDAPERGQAFGKRSRQSLADICAGKSAKVKERGKDQYGRTIGRVTCAAVEANREQVWRGMAWVYVKYAPKDSPLHILEKDARLRRAGLWAERGPVAPWKWREAHSRTELQR